MQCNGHFSKRKPDVKLPIHDIVYNSHTYFLLAVHTAFCSMSLAGFFTVKRYNHSQSIFGSSSEISYIKSTGCKARFRVYIKYILSRRYRCGVPCLVSISSVQMHPDRVRYTLEGLIQAKSNLTQP